MKKTQHNPLQQLEHNLKAIELTGDLGEPLRHVLEPDMIHAVNAALAIRRPLLIWGEPGIGKTQLARAVASQLERPLLCHVVDSQTRSHDLMWRFDAVARLAQAQIQQPGVKSSEDPLAIEKFMVPGPLWWAFNWDSATHAANKSRHRLPDCGNGKIENGAVVLIDEIDKADPDVPNGLLEALGANRFQPQGFDQPVTCEGPPPLVMITTNEERTLPDAFRRRCLALHLRFPKEKQEQRDFLTSRAALNHEFFPDLKEEHWAEAASLLVDDRSEARSNHLYPLPGQAEYFDLLRGLQRQLELGPGDAQQLIERLRNFVYRKHPGLHPDLEEPR